LVIGGETLFKWVANLMAMRIVIEMVRLQHSTIWDGEIMMAISTEGVLDRVNQKMASW